MARTNREILTGGKKYTQNKAKKHAVEEVTFDKSSREEYLTGFHKRKLERQKKAQEFQKEQERLARIEERKKAKLEKQKDLVKQMEKYSKSLKELAGDYETSSDEEDDEDEQNNGVAEEKEEESVETTEEWNGFSDDNDGNKPKGILKRREVYGEDDTEVIIEDISNNDLEHIAKLNYVNLKESQRVLEESIDRAIKYAKIAGVSNKKPKKKFRYLTKNERRENNRKAITNKRRSNKRE